MNVLATTGGEPAVIAVVLGIVFLLLALGTFAVFVSFLADKDVIQAILSGMCAALILVLGIAFLGTKEPVRYEVTLEPGTVIDATKYEVIGQRGQIYVIEPKEDAAE